MPSVIELTAIVSSDVMALNGLWQCLPLRPFAGTCIACLNGLQKEGGTHDKVLVL